MNETYLKIAIDSPFNDSVLTYKGELKIGTIVKVPLGSRMVWGCVLSEVTSLDFDKDKIKEVTAEIEPNISISKEQLELYEWISSYYHYPLGQLIFDSLPKFLKRPRPINLYEGEEKNFYELNPEQSEIYNSIVKKISSGFSRSLIHGVTGSGKSVIFLELIRHVINRGQSVLFMIPEINLTNQFIDFFRNSINAPIYLYNSSLTSSDRYSLWSKVAKEGKPSLVIGSRSSIFVPINNLGLVIVDEEHDSSFKQEDRCPYNGRDIALKKSSFLNIPIVIGSATPSVESYYNYTSIKDYGDYYPLLKRHGNAVLPDIELIDSTDKDKIKNDKIWPFTNEIFGEIRNALSNREQVIVFVNRLGFANFVQCSQCGHRFECKNCSVTLKYFKKKNELSCSYCELKMPLPYSCPECQNMKLVQLGYGTEKLEDVLSQNFPTARIGRFDRDEIKNNNDLNEQLQKFHNNEVDIIIGTQMLSKGHNFKSVNTVIVLGIDSQLNFPDFRSNERAYQLLTQISGRAGRYGQKGRVLVQTLSPENDIFEMVKKHDFTKFYDEEFTLRKLCLCPPFTKMAMIYLSSNNQKLVTEAAISLAERLNQTIKKVDTGLALLGPRPSLIEKRANMFTWSIMIRAKFVRPLHELLDQIQKSEKPARVSVKIDVDPYQIA